MSKARIVFLSVPGIADTLAALRADGWLVESGSTAPGVSVSASYPGAYPRSAVQRVAAELDAAGADYVAVIGAAFDAAMDGPAPAQVDVSSRWQEEGRKLRVPGGFALPAPDVRTLVAAGMGLAEATACIASVRGGALPVMAAAGALAA